MTTEFLQTLNFHFIFLHSCLWWKKYTANNPSDPIIGTIFYLPLWRAAWTTQRSENKKVAGKKKNMLLSHFCTNIATQPNYLACTKTSLICCSQKDVHDFKRLGQVEKHFPFILPLLSTFHLLQWACFVLLCFVLFSCKTMLKENCFLGGSNLKRLSFPPM